MKKMIIPIAVIALIILSACGTTDSSDTNMTIDEMAYDMAYNEEFVESFINYMHEDGIPLVVHSVDSPKLRLCQECGVLYARNYDDATDEYCSTCAAENNLCNGCCMCGEWARDYDELVEFYVEDNPYYMCTSCAAKYFKDIEPMKPCYYCISCGELTSSKKYVHSWTDEIICENCISEYSKCKTCGKYDTDIRDGVCGMCGGF